MALTQIIHDPHDLDDAARDRLGAALYAVHAQIFSGVDPAEFQRYVIESTAGVNRIAVYESDDGAPVGYCALHFFDEAIGGEACTILRCEVGFLRAWRGQAPAGRFVARQLFAWRVQHPRRRLFVFACPVHPASYLTVARRAPTYWPRFDRETPPAEEALMFALAERFGLRRVDPDDAYVRAVGWTTRSTGPEHDYWHSCGVPEVDHYLARNPGYVDGHGLLVLIPLDTPALLRSVGRFFSSQAGRRVTRWQAAVDRLTGGRAVSAEACAERVAQTRLFQGVPHAACRALAKDARQQQIAAGHWVFRRGDRGDALYVIVEGSAVVQISDDPPEVVDQLSAGDVFGELALVTGGPRSASVRAAKATRVLRITDASLKALLAAQPAIGPTLWRNVARIRYDNFLRPPVDETSADRARRLAAFDAGQDLKGDLAGAHASAIFLYEGEAEVTDGAARWRLSAPALIPPGKAISSTTDGARGWAEGRP